MAQLFSKQGGARASKITTPVNATHVSKLFERTKKVDILTIKFPCAEVEGCGSLDIAVSSKMKQKFFKATACLLTLLTAPEKVQSYLLSFRLVFPMFN